MGDTIEYYAPEAVVGDQYNICKGNVTTILPNESLQVMTDVHLYIDGLVPIAYGLPIQFEEGEWFFSNNCNCIVGDDKGATLGHIRKIWVSFLIVPNWLRKNSLHLISQRNW